MKRIDLKLLVLVMDVVVILGMLGLEHRVVFDLMDLFLTKNDHLFFDNFNSTVKFFQGFEKERNLYLWKKERLWMFPPQFYSNLECGQAKYLCSDNLLALER